MFSLSGVSRSTGSSSLAPEYGLGSKLDKLMRENHVSGAELGRAVGVSSQAVSKWRRGVSGINVEHIPLICAYFRISPSELLGYYGPMALADDERELVLLYRKCGPTGKGLIMNQAEYVSEHVFECS